MEIIGAKGKGRYTLPTDATGTGRWSNVGDAATFTLDGVSMETKKSPNSIITGAGHSYLFYMIPQDLDGVRLRFTFADGSRLSTNLRGTWKAGTTKTYALSEANSDWSYVLSVNSPGTVAWDKTATGRYGITSYREDPVTHVQQPVKWKVVGYDGDGDGNYSMTDKPSWLTSLSKEEGDGGTGAETGTATLTTDVTDLLAARNNALKSATALGSASSPYDLSTKGGSVARSTANSYVISAPGYYKIPLVYGNAVKDNADNPGSYKTEHTGARILSTFKDHAGKDIDSPYINVQNTDSPATLAGIVWTDQSGIVEESSLEVTGSGKESYVRFHVPSDKIRNGNAVISVKNSAGTIMWSWHLWFAPQDVLNTTAVTNFQSKVYNFTNETLGWKYTAWKGTTYTSPRSVRVKVEQTAGQAGAKKIGYITITQNNGNARKGYSTLYQFGRKDAMPGTDSTPDGSFNKNGGDNMSIQNGIQNPGTFYVYGSSWYNTPPSGYSYNNLWSMENTTTGYNDNAVVKTIYDPSPAGFHMPANNAFSGFTTTGKQTSEKASWNVSGAWDNGWNFNNKISNPDATVYFPTSGYRNSADGSLKGGHTFYWSALSTDGFGYSLYLVSFHMNPQQLNVRGEGLSVRPVAE